MTARPSALAAGLVAGLTVLAPISAVPAQAQDISDARCQANQAAGKITYLTSYGYAATAGILDVLTAKERGLFKDLCLDVDIEPGSLNTQLVSAGRAQIGAVGGPSDTLIALDNGAHVVGVATYGNTSAVELITLDDGKISSLKDFEGKTIGYKGAVPPQLKAMLQDNGVDTSKINWVSVGYDPIILANRKIDALSAYKSNEPKALEALGYKVKEWDPSAYGIQTAFNTEIANSDFAKSHPTAVQDFLRASFEAFNWIDESDANLDQALNWAAKLSTAGYDIKMSRIRWQTENALIHDSQPEGTHLGQQSIAQWQPEADMLVRYHLVKSTPDVSKSMDTSFVDDLYDDQGKLIWPAK